MPTVKHLKERLNTHYSDNDIITYQIWQVEDVLREAEDMSEELTREEAEQVLDNIDYYADSESGINWGVINTFIRDFINNREEEKENADS